MNIKTSAGLTLLPSDVNLIGSVNSWNPPELASAVALRVTVNAATPNVSGLAGGVTGRILLLVCTAGAFTVTNEDAGSSAANRFTLKASPLTLSAESTAAMLLYYDGSRWREIGFDN